MWYAVRVPIDGIFCDQKKNLGRWYYGEQGNEMESLPPPPPPSIECIWVSFSGYPLLLTRLPSFLPFRLSPTGKKKEVERKSGAKSYCRSIYYSRTLYPAGRRHDAN